jgi:hypothetical protein
MVWNYSEGGENKLQHCVCVCDGDKGPSLKMFTNNEGGVALMLKVCGI